MGRHSRPKVKMKPEKKESISSLINNLKELGISPKGSIEPTGGSNTVQNKENTNPFIQNNSITLSDILNRNKRK